MGPAQKEGDPKMSNQNIVAEFDGAGLTLQQEPTKTPIVTLVNPLDKVINCPLTKFLKDLNKE